MIDLQSPPFSEPAAPERESGLLRSAEGPAESAARAASGASTKTAKILVVDDESMNVKIVQKYLRGAGYQRFITTTDSREAMDLVRRERPDLAVLDIMMPHVSGLDILEAVRSDGRLHHLPVLILTAASDASVKLRALELGATDFLSKPVHAAELVARVRNTLVVKAHHDYLAAHSSQLEHEVRLRTAELAQSRQEVIHVLACAAEYRDQDTGYHVLRVGRYAGLIAQQLGLPTWRVELIEAAAILHDVGKIGIPDNILLKPGKLTPEEFTIMRTHCDCGARILNARHDRAGGGSRNDGLAGAALQSPILQLAADIALTHHEKWDGSGYPRGLAGEQIPIEGRITAVADVFDALSTARPYKEAFPLERCFAILEEGRGSHFDPIMLDAFFARLDDVVRVARELSDPTPC